MRFSTTELSHSYLIRNSEVTQTWGCLDLGLLVSDDFHVLNIVASFVAGA